jgi:hypothetical protein
MTTSTHRVTRYAAQSGWRASCPCGWRSTRKTRELREQDAHAHELADSLEVRRIGTATETRP